MTRETHHSENIPPVDKKFLSIIETHGWHVTRVFNGDKDTGPEFAYSTGLFYSYGHPEILVLGLRLDYMHRIINTIGAEVKRGKQYRPGQEYADILLSYGCQFREVERTHYRTYVGSAIWFYETDPFPLLQCCWPDREGHYPWDPACSKAVAVQQALLLKR